jgi:hypothetical protein
MYQLPRASSPSQAQQWGTLGHLAIAWRTMSSIAPLSERTKSKGRHKNKKAPQRGALWRGITFSDAFA